MKYFCVQLSIISTAAFNAWYNICIHSVLIEIAKINGMKVSIQKNVIYCKRDMRIECVG
jgi:hypothetical protein